MAYAATRSAHARGSGHLASSAWERFILQQEVYPRREAKEKAYRDIWKASQIDVGCCGYLSINSYLMLHSLQQCSLRAASQKPGISQQDRSVVISAPQCSVQSHRMLPFGKLFLSISHLVHIAPEPKCDIFKISVETKTKTPCVQCSAAFSRTRGIVVLHAHVPCKCKKSQSTKSKTKQNHYLPDNSSLAFLCVDRQKMRVG